MCEESLTAEDLPCLEANTGRTLNYQSSAFGQERTEHALLLLSSMNTLSELEEFADDESQPDATRRIAEALASAVNDWPTYNLVTASAYVSELKREIGNALTLANVRAKLDSYAFIDDDDIWKATSLNCLLNAWNIQDENLVLDEIVKRIGVDI